MKNNEIHIRDPYILVHEGKYYMYGTRGPTGWGLADGFDVYCGYDLENWDGPHEVFHAPPGFWADRNYWAPEVHEYCGKYYMLASFKAEGVCRGTQILKADSPLGPFMPWSDGPVTPGDWECLDGTLYVENGTPYMVFCHEWVQIKDGAICSVMLSGDLKQAVGEPKTLFNASEAPWCKSHNDSADYVTDGPFMYISESGELLMIWSSFSNGGYTMAASRSSTGSLNSKYTHDVTPIFKKDGGHGMIFKGLDGKLYITLHTPNNTPEERPRFYNLLDKNGILSIRP